MKILLINVDSKFNIAIRKIYNYLISKDYVDVEMMDLKYKGYPHNKEIIIDGEKYNQVYVSNIFEINKDRVKVINCDWTVYGGIGSNRPNTKLPKHIEDLQPFYHDYEDTSYGFITRGCNNKCSFCKVPKHKGRLKFYNSVESVVKHKKVKFLDNNILAYCDHEDVFKYLIKNNIRCEFNQGLDFRLINDNNAELLSKLNYMGEYTFAFDNINYENKLDEKLKIIKKYIQKDWKLKFYIYQSDIMSIKELIYRVNWCRSNKSLPYIMRDSNCYKGESKNFYIDYTAYCNQPSQWKKKTFEQFMQTRTNNADRRKITLATYNLNKV